MIRVFHFTYRNTKTGRLYFRLSVPKLLRPVVGRCEIVKALGTSDKDVAIPKALRFYADVKSQFSAIQEGLMTKKKSHSVPEDAIGLITVANILPDGSKQEITIDTGNDEKDLEQAKALSVMQRARVALSPIGVESKKLSVLCKEYRDEMIAKNRWRPKTALEHEQAHGLML